jgi:uncharacterized protein (TIGR02996 family)
MKKIQQAFLRDIIEHPENDTPRLIYADWLEENGQADRGQLIRLQCRYVNLYQHYINHHDAKVGNCEECNESHRVSELLTSYPYAARIGEPMACADDCPLNLFPNMQKELSQKRVSVYWTWQRGFILDFRCTWLDWINYGPVLASWHPIESVRIGNAVPAIEGSDFVVVGERVYGGGNQGDLAYNQTGYVIPAQFYRTCQDMVRGGDMAHCGMVRAYDVKQYGMAIYCNSGDQEKFISFMCLRWARSQAVANE